MSNSNFLKKEIKQEVSYLVKNVPFVLVLFTVSISHISHSAPFLPNDLCRRLEPTTETQAFQVASREYPGLKQENLRSLTQEMLLNYLEWASQNNVSALELFTDSAFQDPECVIYVDRETFFKVNRGYELYLIAPIVGYDTKRNVFYTTHFFGGMGNILIFYNRQKTVFNHPIYDNKFELDHVLRHKIARFGRMELKGIRVLINIVFGTLKYNINSLTMLEGRRLEVDAEGHKEINRLLAIAKRRSPTRKHRVFKPSFPGLDSQSRIRAVPLPEAR